ncbi:MAG TPA: cytochrome c oxidase subunit 4 [Thermoleophilaceae bacterium]|jgi:Flp pilus assembly protein TadB|nr:cytochrome c oxidase subunit 4 [Thermoleophilaceae bacterium]
MTSEIESDRNSDGAPEAGEPVHLPEPSYLPVLLAFGITIALVGVVVNWVIVGIGVVIFLVVLVRWIRQTRAEMADLPLEH